MMRIVTIKFRDAGRRYDFNAQDLELANGDQIVVETDRGRALGTVVSPPREVPDSEIGKEMKNVLRIALDEDREMADNNTARETAAFRFCMDRIHQRKMDMKLVRAEYLFDGSKIIFYFTADGRVDFRELVKYLAHHFHTRIEMRQIGVRDEAKLTGGIGICGRELCCCTFLTEFSPVSVKMAKEQGLALNPNKISGQCGRLLCCLGYEFETYCTMKKKLPKCGRRVEVEGREGEVINQKVLAQKVVVRFGDGHTEEAAADSLGEAKPKDSQRPGAQSRQGENKGETAQPRRRKSGGGQRPQQRKQQGESSSQKPQTKKESPARPEDRPQGDGTAGKDGRRRSRRRPRRN
ncbi:MAG: hypothetical protein C0617_13775 [Desulfuromonas sp.]|uniref:PSP1 domain-containing protein n=1 Tax=Desulfuromonas sp. TaxID=892 RepID=UPI000CBFDCC6|nr:MAG: hypothetical protein C0617_13775 [Desulfuromonas sp.]